MGLARYLGRKLVWTIIVFFVALLLNFLLPRLIPGNPVDVIVGTLARGGGASGEDLEKIHAHYMAEFGLDKPLWQQFFIYCNNVLHGNLGTSFSQYPASVNSLIGQALPWSLALMIPAVLIGWIVGNILGAVAARSWCSLASPPCWASPSQRPSPTSSERRRTAQFVSR